MLRTICLILLCTCTHAPVSTGPYSERELRFPSHGTELGATLLLPSSRPPHPGVVFIHGSGPSDRTNPFASTLARQLARRGVAVLLPDKRGSGKSGGDWRTAGFEILADDTAAAVAELRRQREVRKVGLIGFSQGAHVAPLAASRTSHAAFVVAISGSVVPMIVQMRDEVTLKSEAAGLTEGEATEIADIQRLAEEYGQTARGWEAYEARRSAAANRDWPGRRIAQGFPSDPNSPVWSFARMIAPYDPMPFWRTVRAPALFLYGERDSQVRVRQSAEILQREIPGRYTIHFFPEAGHALFTEGRQVIREDVISTLAEWIERHTGMRLHSPAPETAEAWVCPPCGLPCDERVFQHGGACPVCRMELIPKRN